MKIAVVRANKAVLESIVDLLSCFLNWENTIEIATSPSAPCNAEMPVYYVASGAKKSRQ